VEGHWVFGNGGVSRQHYTFYEYILRHKDTTPHDQQKDSNEMAFFSFFIFFQDNGIYWDLVVWVHDHEGLIKEDIVLLPGVG